jgi:hypothetical protein
MAINTTTLEANLTTKINATSGSTDGKEFLLLGKAVEALTIPVSVSDMTTEGTTQVGLVNTAGATQVAAVNAAGSTFALKSQNLGDIPDPNTALSNLGFATQFNSPSNNQVIMWNNAISKWVNGDNISPVNTAATNPPFTNATAYVLGDLWVNSSTAEIFVCTGVDATVSPVEHIWVGTEGTTIGIAQGEFLFVNENYQGYYDASYSLFTTTFTVPAGVTSMSAVCVGGGGGGHSTWANPAGGGGALAWANNITVTPGEVITVEVGNGGGIGNHGGDTKLKRANNTLIFGAAGGKHGATTVNDIAAPISGSSTPGNNATGRGGLCSSNGYGGGGGAGGYSGHGGNGSYTTSAISNANTNSTFNNSANGSGGAASGGIGYGSSTYGHGGGGGVGLYGEGESGSVADLSQVSNSFQQDMRHAGRPGSGGEAGVNNHNQSATVQGANTNLSEGYGYFGNWNNTTKSFPSMSEDGTVKSTADATTATARGGHFGGGGAGSGTSASAYSGGFTGGMGGARVLWGSGRSFPSTKVMKMTNFNPDGTTY